MNNHIYCSRKGGATINGKFYPHPTVNEILAKQYKRKADKIEGRHIAERHNMFR